MLRAQKTQKQIFAVFIVLSSYIPAIKAPRNRHPHDSLQTALQSAFPIDARRLTVLTALILAVVQACTVVLYTLKNRT